MASVEESFRRLTIGDPTLVAVITDHESRTAALRWLDPRTEALLRVAALVSLDAPQSSYRAPIADAIAAGARLEDFYAVLSAIAPDVGSARVVSAAPRIATLAGYDVEAALE